MQNVAQLNEHFTFSLLNRLGRVSQLDSVVEDRTIESDAAHSYVLIASATVKMAMKKGDRFI
jgi:hypothetical protein